MTAPIILASTSVSRKAMLQAAGVPFASEAPRVDEDIVKDALLAENASPRNIADALAELKAVKISNRHPEALVIGSDQVLVLDDKMLSKAETLAEARKVLEELRGRPHQLIAAAVIAKGGQAIWRGIETATLIMRPFSNEFLDEYLAAEGEFVLGSVGCYRIEARGAQLFSSVVGCQFVIRGLPLLGVLDCLRANGALVA